MYKKKMSGLTLGVIMCLAITILCSITFGTLAYFRLETNAAGLITIGSNIDFIICDANGVEKNTSSVEITDFSQTSHEIGFYIKKSAGVNAKLRVYVAVSIEDANGNLQNMINGSNAIVTVNMSSSSEYSWVNDASATANELLIGSHWRYLKTADGSSDYKLESSNNVISICPSITVNANSYAGLGYKIIVTLTAEMLQYDKASW